ncbi:MAG TPA: hypothetical protein VKH64_01390 [Candidatus Binatia bacterium]|nr:hypothetical protein [Candidatus Binatia bacterium]
MAEEFVVPINASASIDEIVPVLERIAPPGAKVTFLFSCPVDIWTWLRDHWVVTESTAKAVAEGKKLMARYSWEEQKRLAEQKVAAVRWALAKHGVETAVAVGGSLSRMLRDYLLHPDFQVLLLSTANGSTTLELARLCFALLRRVRATGLTPILLYRSERKISRGDALASVQ